MSIFSFELFGITIAPSYYGLMYALGFIFGYWLIKKRIFINPSPSITLQGLPLKKGEIMENNKKINILKPATNWKIGDFMDSLLFYIFFGVVIGGRLGYVIFYNFSHFISNPLDILKVWEGGMSFHGGIIGVIIAMILFAKKQKINFYKLADQVALVVPIGLGLGRLGNYLNKELLGFDGYNGPLNINGRFPSPLVELFLEGIVLFIILNLVYWKSNIIHPPAGTSFNTKGRYSLTDGQIASLLLILYGIFRIFVEAVFREPDAHIGYIWNYFTLGEIYSLPMVIIGIYFYFKLAKQKK